MITIYYEKESHDYIIFKYLEFNLNSQGHTLITHEDMKRITHNKNIMKDLGGRQGFIDEMRLYGFNLIYDTPSAFLFQSEKISDKRIRHYFVGEDGIKHIIRTSQEEYKRLENEVINYFNDMYKRIEFSERQIEEEKKKMDYNTAKEIIISLIDDENQERVYIEEGDFEFFDYYFTNPAFEKNNRSNDSILGELLGELPFVKGVAFKGNGTNNVILYIDMNKISSKYYPDILKRQKIRVNREVEERRAQEDIMDNISVQVSNDDWDYYEYEDEDEEDDYDYYAEQYERNQREAEERRRREEEEEEERLREEQEFIDDYMYYKMLEEDY